MPSADPDPKPNHDPDPAQAVPIAGETAYEVRRFACGEQGTAVVLSDGAVYVWGMQVRTPQPWPKPITSSPEVRRAFARSHSGSHSGSHSVAH